MDLNLVVIAGHLTAEPEVKTFENGKQLARFLVTVRTGEDARNRLQVAEESRKRIDVVLVVLYEPDSNLLSDIATGGLRGIPVWVAGSVQRRFWATESRTSRIEVVAQDVKLNLEINSLEDAAL